MFQSKRDRDRPYYTQTPPPKKVRLSPDEQIQMYKPYQSFENFLKKLKKWQKQKVKTHGFDFTMYYVV